ncbi:2641_t:CDS:2 [Ambispora gerdemannii]|uniref:Endocytosis protein 3 n=1 Tax=Ambispora gerdemannii TaxID=144530 RepID=A0A9N8ZGE1_9GLOM|nr:2641_t:CDS:2 [Ambispora gerdemannii]
MSGITNNEKIQYFSMFNQLGPVNGFITGSQAHKWLVNSKLPVHMLERIWDLCDIDKDGNLDFDEFAVTYRLVNDLLAGIYPDVPPTLPQHLIPQSKLHLLAARGSGGNVGNLAGGGTFIGTSGPITSEFNTPGIGQINNNDVTNLLSAQHRFPPIPPPVPAPLNQFSQVPPPVPPPPTLHSSYGGFPSAPLTDDFDWYMPPADKFNYENQYSSHVGAHGYVQFAYFDELYLQLGIPREECIAAWNLADVNFEQRLGKDACLVFLHILNQRSKGKRIPSQLPNALKTSLLRGKLNYNYNETLDPTSTTRRARTDPNDSGSTRSYGGTKREEEQLLHKLADLNERIQKAEERALSSYTSALSSSTSSETITDFQQLLEYKQKQLSALKDLAGAKQKSSSAFFENYIRREKSAVRELEENIQLLKTQMSILETEYSSSERDLRQLQQDIEVAKSGR